MKRTWFFGLLCTLLTLLLSGYTVTMQRKMIVQEARSDTANLINLVGMDLSRTCSSLDQIFLGLENHLTPDPSGTPIDPPEIRRIIDYLVLQTPYLAALMVLDDQGQVMHWNNNFQKPNLRHKAYFQAHGTVPIEGLFFGPPKPSIINEGQWSAGVSKAIRKNDNSLAMVMVGIVDLKYFARQYRPMLTSPGTTLTVASPGGLVYTRISNRKTPFDTHGSGTAVKVRAEDSREIFSMSQQVGNYPLLVTVTKEKGAVLASWEQSSLMFTVLGLTVSALLLFMTWRTVVHQQRQLEIKEEMYQRSGTDPLTKLANQVRILDQAKLEIKKAVRTQSSLSVILLDLDFFKMINDRYGRRFGDHVLKKTAEIITDSDRASDLVSRYGGTNFLLLLPDTDLRGAVVLARKIHNKMAQTSYPKTDDEFQVTASFGVSQWASGEEDIEPAVQRAAAALYEVKKSGRNNIRWMPSGLSHEQIDDSVVWLHSKDRQT